MKKLLIFDLDGTLADTLPSITRAINLASEKLGYPQHSCEEVRGAIGNGARNLVRRLMPESDATNEEKVDRFLKTYEDMYDTTYMEANKCYDGMSEAIRELHKRGYGIAVLSNKQDAYVKPIAAQLIPSDILAYAAGQRKEYPKKPDPTVPLMIAGELGVAPENTAFIGDSDVDIITGKNAGMFTVGCDWGYRGRAELESVGADRVISHPTELLEIFK
ncbi:MAG: HAD family hydrolase [Ruminococcaceae bacterium]|nr:HAD family hydrolase [Oscillospiraceae bacterium]